MKICTTRGCGSVISAAQFTRCPECLLGTKRLDRLIAQQRAVDALPPLAVAAGTWAFRVAGLPVGWNNALVRPKHGRPFLSVRAREWKRMIALEAIRTRPRGWPLSARYSLDLHSVFVTPRADRDGPLKLVQDALEGVAWRNDAQVLSGRTSKAVDPAAPRIEVVVRQLAVLV